VRVGIGTDVHPIEQGRPCWMAGLLFEDENGCAGHSDGDVLSHAICDALLGAAGAGDIGTHFPDSDPQYKNVASSKLLNEVLHLMRRRRFKLVNADFTLVAQQPKLAPHYGSIRKSVASLCSVAQSRINIKATTTEKLGWTGAGRGMAATAVVLLQR